MNERLGNQYPSFYSLCYFLRSVFYFWGSFAHSSNLACNYNYESLFSSLWKWLQFSFPSPEQWDTSLSHYDLEDFKESSRNHEKSPCMGKGVNSGVVEATSFPSSMLHLELVHESINRYAVNTSALGRSMRMFWCMSIGKPLWLSWKSLWSQSIWTILLHCRIRLL